MPRTTIGGGGFSVLEDPSGRRARWMRRAGRVVFIVFLGWLLAIALGGLGLAPVGGIPFTQSLRPSSGPAPLAKLPQPRQPSASDLRPAAPVAAGTGAAGQQARLVPVRQHGQSATAPGHANTTTVTVSHGRRATAPGHTRKTTTVSHGQSATAPGHAKTTTTTTTVSHGRSTTVPGHTKTTTTTTTVSHGRSSTVPGKQKN
jgi:hypothetical protein